ncbi:MAG: DnaB-like helicase C-terminal domain-containing protein [Clostridia bacterium]|nr:DnaB-like helicase C-terminal domain-containing protein [Clostridia bacterium]
MYSMRKGAGSVIQTGLRELDDLIGGFYPGELVVIAARPGMGKTALGIQTAINASKCTGKKVVYFSLELSNEQLKKRIVKADAAFNASTIIISDSPGASVADMKILCCGMGDLGLVVIDYLQLLNRRQHDRDRPHKIAETSCGIKNMARELNVPVVCVSQLSGALEKRENKRPSLRGMTHSDYGALVQDADVIIGLYRESYYRDKCENPYTAEAIVLKNRYGEIGTVPLRFLPECVAFISAAQQSE